MRAADAAKAAVWLLIVAPAVIVVAAIYIVASHERI